MSTFEGGFFIKRITVSGIGLPDAVLDLNDGLNVIEGASDTGKSFLADLIDFSFGASKLPRQIQAAEGYERVYIILQERKTRQRHEIERRLAGGDVIVRVLHENGGVENEQILAAKHSADNDKNLSSYLLSLSGFEPTKIRKNKRGETRSLSFRDVAHLTVINETRIISELPPHLSGSHVLATAESEVFRFVITRHPSAQPITGLKKVTSQTAKVQAQLLTQLEEQVLGKITALGLQPENVKEEAHRIEAIRGDIFKKYEEFRVELIARERERSDLGRTLRDVESRIAVIEGLSARFELLDQHYQMDIARLGAIEETGSMLEEMPASSCPVCGATPEAHHPSEAAEHFGLDRVRSAARKEREKTTRLRSDLQNVINDLREENEQKLGLRERIRSEVKALQARIDSELAPRARMSSKKLKEQDGLRDTLLQALALVEQLKDLKKRRAAAEEMAKRTRSSSADNAPKATTSEMDGFAQGVQQVLTAWRYPEAGRVVFSEDAQDLVISGQDRASHGKGVRALTCAAFITGILRHCALKGLAHPGLAVLDSPLVAYKDPDSLGSDSAQFMRAGVKEAFYQTLADGLCPGQFIILENQEPPMDLADRFTHHHFSKSNIGRYGFFPNIGNVSGVSK